MKLKKYTAVILSIVMGTMALTGCGGNKPAETQDTTAETTETTETADAGSGKEDVIKALLPPVSGEYQDRLDSYIAEFEKDNPNVKVEVTKASWEDATQKLDVQVNAGSPPDIAFIGCDGISKYLDAGMLVDITPYLNEDELKDFDQKILTYYKKGEGLYGLPAYCEVQAIGGNQEKLEAAGIDWKKVQKEGWTYDEFREAIKKGVVKNGNEVDTYGFVFACSGVTAKDYFSIFVTNTGMATAFNDDMKYTYTSKQMLDYLKDLRALIDDGSMPKSLSSIDAGKRWNMFLTGQTMITGKGLSVFERSAYMNNEKLDEKSPDAVKDSIKANYIVLPVPVFEGGQERSYCAVDGYICLTGEKNPDQEHLQNVANFMYYMASGKRAAETCQELYITPVCTTGETEYAKLPPIENKNEFNTEAVKRLIQCAAPVNTEIPPEKSAEAIKIEDEVIVPKFQGLLAGEVTPEEMYEAIKSAGIEKFGEDGCVID